MGDREEAKLCHIRIGIISSKNKRQDYERIASCMVEGFVLLFEWDAFDDCNEMRWTLPSPSLILSMYEGPC